MKQSKLKKLIVLSLITILVLGTFNVSFAVEVASVKSVEETAEQITMYNGSANDASTSVENKIPSQSDTQSLILEPELAKEDLIEIDMDAPVEDIPIEFSIKPASGIKGASRTISPKVEAALATVDLSEINQIDGRQSANSLSDAVVSRASKAASTVANWEFEGACANPGDIEQYGIIALDPGEILQAGLVCPASPNMDYDLLLIDVDPNTAAATIIKTSSYVTYYGTGNNKTLDEGLDYINNTSATKYFIIGVHAYQGSGAMMPFTLYLSVDIPGNFIAGENDQNAANPCASFTFNQSFSGVPLNTRADVDWFSLSWGEYPGYKHLQMNISAGNNGVELYKNLGGGKYQKINPTSGTTYTFDSTIAHNYLVRVYTPNRNNFSWNTYTLSCSLTAAPARPWEAIIQESKFASNTNSAGQWLDYGTGISRFSVHYWMTVGGYLLDAFGNRCPNEYIDVKFTNDAWVRYAGPDSLKYAYSSARSDSAGNWTTTFNIPEAYGDYIYVSSAGYLTKFDIAYVDASVNTGYNGVVNTAREILWHKAISYNI